MSRPTETHKSSHPAPRQQDHEAGVALIAVLLVAIVVGGLIVLMFNSSMFEVRSTARASQNEAALHNAEAGMEARFASILETPEVLADPSTLQVLPVFADRAAERAWVLTEITGQTPQVDGSSGTGLGIGPFRTPVTGGGDPMLVVYGIGTTGPEGQRVVKVTVQGDSFDDEEVVEDEETGTSQTADFGGYAVLSGGDFHAPGQVKKIDGPIHVNGDVWATNPIAGAGISATGEVRCAVNSHCADLNERSSPGAEPQTVPDIWARHVYREYASQAPEGGWFDFCPPNATLDRPTVRSPAPPAGADLPKPEPCTGPEIPNNLDKSNGKWDGWSYEAGSNSFHKDSGGSYQSGVYYAHGANVITTDLNANARHVTVLASRDMSRENDGAWSGNIDWRGSPIVYYSGYAGELALFADGDIYTSSGGGQRWSEGVVYARGKIDIRGVLGGQAGQAANQDSRPMVGRLVALNEGVPGAPLWASLDAHLRPPTSSSGDHVNYFGDGSDVAIYFDNSTISMQFGDYTFDFDPGEELAPDPGDDDDPQISIDGLRVLSWVEL